MYPELSKKTVSEVLEQWMAAANHEGSTGYLSSMVEYLNDHNPVFLELMVMASSEGFSPEMAMLLMWECARVQGYKILSDLNETFCKQR